MTLLNAQKHLGWNGEEYGVMEYPSTILDMKVEGELIYVYTADCVYVSALNEDAKYLHPAAIV